MLRILRFLSDLLEKEKVAPHEHGDKTQSPTSLHELHERLIDLEKEMKVWSLRARNRMESIPLHPEGVFSLAFSCCCWARLVRCLFAHGLSLFF